MSTPVSLSSPSMPSRRHLLRGVALAAIAWNAFGCFQWAETLRSTYEALLRMGLDHDAATTLAGLPVWMDVAFGVGVIGGLAGSVLLLARRRLALPVFVASLIGYCVLFVGDVTEGVFAALGASQVVVLTFVVAIAIGLVAHSRALARRGFLA